LWIGQTGDNNSADHQCVKPKRKGEKDMNHRCRFAIVLGIGLGLAPWAVAQAPAQPPEVAPSPATVIPPDQQATKEQMAKLFEVMRVREQMASMTKMMPSMMQQQMQQQFKQTQKVHPELAQMTEEQQQACAKVMSKYMEKVMTLYTSDEMFADMASLYQKHLTRSDVDETIAFYSSPAGKHMLDMVPVIMQEYMPMVMERIQDRISPLIDEMTKDMEAAIKSNAPAVEKPATK
jgi:hypothetical protein